MWVASQNMYLKWGTTELGTWWACIQYSNHYWATLINGWSRMSKLRLLCWRFLFSCSVAMHRLWLRLHGICAVVARRGSGYDSWHWQKNDYRPSAVTAEARDEYGTLCRKTKTHLCTGKAFNLASIDLLCKLPSELCLVFIYFLRAVLPDKLHNKYLINFFIFICQFYDIYYWQKCIATCCVKLRLSLLSNPDLKLIRSLLLSAKYSTCLFRQRLCSRLTVSWRYINLVLLLLFSHEYTTAYEQMAYVFVFALFLSKSESQCCM